MGANNLKIENEFMAIPNFIPGISPVKTEADPTVMTGIASQLGQLVLAVSQMHQFIQGQSVCPRRAAIDRRGRGRGKRPAAERANGRA